MAGRRVVLFCGDIIEVLTDSPTLRQYWGKVKDRECTKFQLSPIWGQLKLLSKDGKKYKTDLRRIVKE